MVSLLQSAIPNLQPQPKQPAGPQPIVCEYFIQSEEYENSRDKDPYFNVFLLPKKYERVEDVRLKDVVDAFPLHNQDKVFKYYLRFETLIQLSARKKLQVWIDIGTNYDVKVPTIDGKIRIKALRLPKGVDLKNQNNQNRNANNLQVPSQQQATQRIDAQQKNQQQIFGRHSDVYGNQKASLNQEELIEPNTESKAKNLQKRGSDRQGGLLNESQQKALDDIFGKPQPAQATDANFIDTNNLNMNDQQPFVQAQNDTFNMNQNPQTNFVPNMEPQEEVKDPFVQVNDAPFSTPLIDDQQASSTDFFNDNNESNNINSTAQQQQQPQASQNDLLQQMNGFVFETPSQSTPDQKQEEPLKPVSAQEALKQKFEKDEAALRDYDDAQSRLEDKIQHWIGRPKKNHVRVLLCTLSDVLWENCGWERVSIDMLMEKKQVKTAFRKSQLLFHPDKIEKYDDPDKRYIANHAFAAITEAYSDFEKSG